MIFEEIRCRDVVELVTDYFEGAMSECDRDAFERHLVLCSGCKAYLEQMSETIRLAGVLREDDVAPEVMAELLTAFRSWCSVPRD